MVVRIVASAAAPVAFVELVALIAGANPIGAFIGRTGPISIMPAIPVSHRVIIAFDPEETRAGSCGMISHNARRGRGANSDTDGEIGGEKATS